MHKRCKVLKKIHAENYKLGPNNNKGTMRRMQSINIETKLILTQKKIMFSCTGRVIQY